MRIQTLNTSLVLTLQNPDQGAGGDKDKDKNKDGSDTSDGSGNDQDGSDQEGQDGQDGSDQDGSDQDSDQDGDQDGQQKGKPQKGKAKSNGKPQKGDNQVQKPEKGEGETEDGYGDTSGGKGKHQGGGADAPTDLSDVAQQLADAIEQGLFGTMDRDDALTDAVEQEVDAASPLANGENRYQPDRNNDTVETLGHSPRDVSSINRVLKGIAKESGQVKVGLARMIRAMEQTNVFHGTKDGRLSSRQYARTWAELKGGKVPTRPYKKRSNQMDVSIACAVVVDQSSSMSGLKNQTIKGMCALADALSAVGAALQVSGYRYGGNYYGNNNEGILDHNRPSGRAHRHHGITIDVFQNYGERFSTVKGRYAHLRACGGTPTADGMQFALEGLSVRAEAYRIMFVLTDGCPDGGHQPVINHQIRLAKEAGIHIVGVGLGRGTGGVVHSYPDSVVASNMSQLPQVLLGKLRSILKPEANRRGKRIAK